MATKTMAPAEWVKLAASTDSARPVLCALHADGDRVEACDGHKLHRYTGGDHGVRNGLWDVKTGTATDGQYPALSYVIPSGECTHMVHDLAEFAATVAAAVAYGKALGDRYSAVTLPCSDGSSMRVSARYLSDMLRGMPASGTLMLLLTGSDKPLRADLGAGRIAVIMPIRAASGANQRSARFDLSCTVREATAEDRAAA
jgi:hypothetical protein